MSQHDSEIRQEFAEVTFRLCVDECLANEDFMREYRRLTGHSIGAHRPPIARMVDEACGRPAVDEAEARDFFQFVRRYVWQPWLSQMAAGLGKATR